MQRVKQPDANGRVARAHRDHDLAQHFASQNEHWAAVVAFYSAYHLARAAFEFDPIFNDPVACFSRHQLLTPRHRDTHVHTGRTRPYKVWGVNELVALLYPRVGVDYEQLHVASVQVRYGQGLTTSLTSVLDQSTRILAAFDDGRMRTV